MISIIIPVFNENKNLKIIKNNLKLFKKKEVIIVDGGHSENIKKFSRCFKYTYLKSSPSRGLQMSLGAKKATADWLIFLHADTSLSKKNIADLNIFLKKSNYKKVAYFKLIFSDNSKLAKLISYWCYLRTTLFKIPYGDQCLIISRDYYVTLGGYKKIPIMEDLDFILRVPLSNRYLLTSSIKTSFRNYKNNGVLRQCLKHFICQVLFLIKVNTKYIKKLYNLL